MLPKLEIEFGYKDPYKAGVFDEVAWASSMQLLCFYQQVKCQRWKELHVWSKGIQSLQEWVMLVSRRVIKSLGQVLGNRVK